MPVSATFQYGAAVISLGAGSAAELLADLARFGIAGSVTAPAPAPKAEAPGKPAKAAATSAAPASAPAASSPPPATAVGEAPPKSESAAPAVKPSAAPAPATVSADYIPVRERILALAKTPGGPDKVVALLAQFGVDHGSKLTPDQYPAVLEAAAKVQ